MRRVSQRGVKGPSMGLLLFPFPASATPCLPAADPGPSIQDPQTAPPVVGDGPSFRQARRCVSGAECICTVCGGLGMVAAHEMTIAVGGSAGAKAGISKGCGKERPWRLGDGLQPSTRAAEDAPGFGKPPPVQQRYRIQSMPPKQGSGWACRGRDSGRCAGVATASCGVCPVTKRQACGV
ncbi:hypothetical protein QBC39DRAFT_173635 [Podospora conica]|nr:hypothetical protein QBC39DRAFT_173635 [Schizothecium conicum]